MHELALCEGVVRILEAEAAVHAASRIRAVWLEVGDLANVEVEAIRFCFDAVTRDTIAEQARLEIEQTPGVARCAGCAATVRLAARYEPCPACGSYDLSVLSGADLRVRRMEVD